MIMRFHTFAATIVLGAIMAAGASCSGNNPEAFCQDWVESTCQAISTCCQDGTRFDMDGCRVGLSESCQSNTGATLVETGQASFDSGAASACLGTVTSCSEYASTTTSASTYAHQQACANMLTGDRPLGAACNSSDQCARAGDFSTCYSGSATSTGVCAQAVLDTTGCSFSFSNSELHMCPDGTFCDRAAAHMSSEPPSQQEFEFSAPCRPYLGAGEKCDDVTGPPVPCAAGLFCKVNGAGGGTCTPYKTAGEACVLGDGCAPGLACLGAGEMGTCQPISAQGGYCYTTTKCGDGVCTPPETPQSCPQDCGFGGVGCGTPGDACGADAECCPGLACDSSNQCI